MIDLLKDNINQIADICARYEVATLYVFGSALRDDYDPNKSDIDFLIEFKPCLTQGRAKRYFDLETELLKLLDVEKIDLVETDAVSNPYFAKEINKTKLELYAA